MTLFMNGPTETINTLLLYDPMKSNEAFDSGIKCFSDDCIYLGRIYIQN